MGDNLPKIRAERRDRSPAPQGRVSYPCRQFIKDVVAAAILARRTPSGPARRRALATALVQRYVPPMQMLGLDVRRLIVRNVRGGPEEIPAPARVPGFRRALTAGGQGGEALRHLAAAAATVLMRKGILRITANALDHIQGIVRGNPGEARAEIAGNRAGAAMGRHLLAFLKETTTEAGLATSLRSLLGQRRGSKTGPRSAHRQTNGNKTKHARKSRA